MKIYSIWNNLNYESRRFSLSVFIKIHLCLRSLLQSYVNDQLYLTIALNFIVKYRGFFWKIRAIAHKLHFVNHSHISITIDFKFTISP